MQQSAPHPRRKQDRNSFRSLRYDKGLPLLLYLLSFRERYLAEAQFPRIKVTGNLTNRTLPRPHRLMGPGLCVILNKGFRCTELSETEGMYMYTALNRYGSGTYHGASSTLVPFSWRTYGENR